MFLRPAASACLLGASCLLIAQVGCQSAVSTHVAADSYEGGWKTKSLRGIPVTVKVPTHLELRVIERRYYTEGSSEPFHVARIVEHEIREKDRVFTVDSVRPAAGTATYSASLENSKNPQFFSKFDTKIEDSTVKSISALVPKLPDVLANIKKATQVSRTIAEAPDTAIKLDSLVAVKLFDVNAPDLAQCVQAFLDQHVNNCAPPCPANCRVK
jgi:hypothetical protein